MEKNESSISIINKNNGTLTGEKAQAFPIRIETNNLKWKYFFYGVVFTTCLTIIGIYIAKQGVDIVNTENKATQYVEYSL